VIVCREGRIEREDLRLPNTVQPLPAARMPQPEDGLDSVRHAVKLLLDQQHPQLYEALEQLIISTAFEHCAENQLRTSRELGISRNVLRAQLKRFGLLGERFLVSTD
jgi:sigma-54-specific transcriptional regulator